MKKGLLFVILSSMCSAVFSYDRINYRGDLFWREENESVWRQEAGRIVSLESLGHDSISILNFSSAEMAICREDGSLVLYPRVNDYEYEDYVLFLGGEGFMWGDSIYLESQERIGCDVIQLKYRGYLYRTENLSNNSFCLNQVVIKNNQVKIKTKEGYIDLLGHNEN